MDQQTTAFDVETHLAAMQSQGFTVIADFIDPATLAEVRSALEPFLGSHHGRNAFEGFSTERVYTLVARAKVFERLTDDARLMALLDRVLLPGFLLTASQAISIEPGEAAQGLHTDDGFYGLKRPRAAVSYSLIAAIDDFTWANGATEIIPGSHLWGDPGDPGRPATHADMEPMLVPMEIPAGAAIVFPGTLVHRGGANRTDKSRLALTNQYCQAWARTQENFYLGVPREQVRDMSPRLQTLLGYDIHPTFMGMVSSVHPRKALEPGWVPPVVAQVTKR
jgi:ectoine hydroxylase-related dioxygenase (phytanoyl-CoA dioxygenase family)